MLNLRVAVGPPDGALVARPEVPPRAPVDRGAEATPARAVLDFDEVYDAHVDFVCTTLWRLGVMDSAVEDAAQDVFVVVHRRLAEFVGPAPLRAWIYAIALRVARDHRRTVRRKGGLDELRDHIPDHGTPSPLESASQSEGLRILNALLDGLSDEKREVFVMSEIEQMTAPEIAAILGANVNTVSARLRAARAEFERAVARHQRRGAP